MKEGKREEEKKKEGEATVVTAFVCLLDLRHKNLQNSIELQFSAYF